MSARSPLTERLSMAQAAGGFPSDVVRRFERFLDMAAEEALFRMSPLRYAVDAGVEPSVAIDLFLHATGCGALEMVRGVLCPACGAFLPVARDADRSSEARSCGFCDVPVSQEREGGVEVAFTVAPAVRRIRFHEPAGVGDREDVLRYVFSSGVADDNPMLRWLTEGMRLQRLRAGEELVIESVFARGRYVVVEPSGHALLCFWVADGGDRVAGVDLLNGRMDPERVRLGAAGATLTLRNRMDRAVTLGLCAMDRGPDMRSEPAVLGLHLTLEAALARRASRELFGDAGG